MTNSNPSPDTRWHTVPGGRVMTSGCRLPGMESVLSSAIGEKGSHAPAPTQGSASRLTVGRAFTRTRFPSPA